MTSFRILTIDGGGVRGAIPAAFLKGLEEVSGRRVADSFDLIAGTSTGGIIALGLAANIPAARILEFYRTASRQIFPSPRFPVLRGAQRALRRTVGALYDHAALRRALEECFGSTKMGDLRQRVMVPTFDGVHGEMRLIKSSYLEKLYVDPSRSLVEAALATSAAPTYLPGHVSANGERLLDGGLWANNPIAIAVVEAIGNLGVPAAEIDVLSLGTGSPAYTYPRSALRGGILRFALGQAREAVLVAQATGAVGMAKTLLGSATRVFRISPALTPGLSAMDDSDAVGDLIALGHREAQHHTAEVTERFLKRAASPFVVGRIPASST